MTEIGPALRSLRRRGQLTLREVEHRSERLAKSQGNEAYQISASWLNRMEREDHELTVTKLIALAEIYNIPSDRLLRSAPDSAEQSSLLRQLSEPNAVATLPTVPPAQKVERFSREGVSTGSSPDNMTLLSSIGIRPHPRYRHGIIGKHDLTLYPMIPHGSIVQIDTWQLAISPRKDWKHEFQRPIYFLKLREGYVCGWCELDKHSEWLTLVPHPLSPTHSRRWRYQEAIENVGRVHSVAVSLLH